MRLTRLRTVTALTALSLALSGSVATTMASASDSDTVSSSSSDSGNSGDGSSNAGNSSSDGSSNAGSNSGDGSSAASDSSSEAATTTTISPGGTVAAPDSEASTSAADATVPENVAVDHIEWQGARQAMVYVRSAAMPDTLQKFQLLLPRDWYSAPDRTFPTLIALDDFNAPDSASGWLTNTQLASQFANRNVTVVLPVGGAASMYTDWADDSSRKYETYLMKELLPLLTKDFRASAQRAIIGASMGGTAAITLAEHNPDTFAFVGSFSGLLDTSTHGMPDAIAYELKTVAGLDATKMWGSLGGDEWLGNDPKLGVTNLKGTSVYVSAGNGNQGVFPLGAAATSTTDTTDGYGLEALARLTTATFAQAAEQWNIPVTARFRSSGTHTWPYWQLELQESWGQMADALGLAEEDRSSSCSADADFAQAATDNASNLGTCLTAAYSITSTSGQVIGKAQDFTNGRIVSSATGPHALWGPIAGLYSNLGGAASQLGFPTNNMLSLARDGWTVPFEHGSIYYAPSLGAWVVTPEVMSLWAGYGYENGELGYPTSAQKTKDGGLWQQFEGGVLVHPSADKTYVVKGQLGTRYAELGGPESSLGWPTGNQEDSDSGSVQYFEHGALYYSSATGAHVVYEGAIFDEWTKHSAEKGEYGYPTADPVDQDGTTTLTLQHGVIREKDGKVEATLNDAPTSEDPSDQPK